MEEMQEDAIQYAESWRKMYEDSQSEIRRMYILANQKISEENEMLRKDNRDCVKSILLLAALSFIEGIIIFILTT